MANVYTDIKTICNNFYRLSISICAPLFVGPLFTSSGVYAGSCRPFDESVGIGPLKFLFSTFLATYPSLYHPANLEGILPIENPEAEMTLAHIFIHVESILIVALSSTIKLPDAKHMDVLKPIAI